MYRQLSSIKIKNEQKGALNEQGDQNTSSVG